MTNTIATLNEDRYRELLSSLYVRRIKEMIREMEIATEALENQTKRLEVGSTKMIEIGIPTEAVEFFVDQATDDLVYSEFYAQKARECGITGKRTIHDVRWVSTKIVTAGFEARIRSLESRVTKAQDASRLAFHAFLKAVS